MNSKTQPETPVPTVRKGSSGFVGNVLALSGAAVVAQAIGLLAAPVISRLFDPDAFGVAAVFGAVTGTIGLCGCLSYELAIVLPKSDDDAVNLFALCICVILATTGLVALLTFVGGPAFLETVHIPELIPYRWLIPFAVLVVGAGLPLRYWYTRHRQFKRLGLTNVTAAVVGAGMVIGVGSIGFQEGKHLILARMAGIATPALLLAWFFLREDHTFLFQHCTISKMRHLGVRHSRFPLFQFWSALLNTASREAPIILLAGFFGPVSAGLFSLSTRVLSLPGTLISNAIGQVFFQRAAAKRADGDDLSVMVKQMIFFLSAIALIPLFVIGLAGPQVFTAAFGARWAQSGVYASILVPWIACMVVCSPLTALYSVLERQAFLLGINVVLLCGRVAALTFGALISGNALWTLALFSFVGVAVNVVQLVFLVNKSGGQMGVILKRLLFFLVFATPSILTIILSRWWFRWSDQFVLASAVVSTVPYCLLVLRFDSELRNVILHVLGKSVGKN